MIKSLLLLLCLNIFTNSKDCGNPLDCYIKTNQEKEEVKYLKSFLDKNQVNSQNWVLVWSDDFNFIDQSKWNYDIGAGGWGNNELEYNTNESKNSFISNGNLVIQALKEGNSYTSARMNTKNKWSIKYGKFEIRAKLPYGKGIWPAFWMLGDDINQVGWPACGEIDIMEFIGKDPNHVHASIHGPGYDFTQSYYSQNGFSNDFHTYTVDWQPDKMRFYVDGNLFYTVYPSMAQAKNWPFNQNFFIILNLAVGGNWPGNPDQSTTFPQQFIIDYLRVWELAQ